MSRAKVIRLFFFGNATDNPGNSVRFLIVRDNQGATQKKGAFLRLLIILMKQYRCLNHQFFILKFLRLITADA